MLCDALEQNFTEYKVRSYKRSANLADRVEDKAYYESKIEEAKKNVTFSFTIDEGRKYLKIMFKDSGGGNSVHAFCEVYKEGLVRFTRFSAIHLYSDWHLPKDVLDYYDQYMLIRKKLSWNNVRQFSRTVTGLVVICICGDESPE